jgi:hypothetical protein
MRLLKYNKVTTKSTSGTVLPYIMLCQYLQYAMSKWCSMCKKQLLFLLSFVWHVIVINGMVSGKFIQVNYCKKGYLTSNCPLFVTEAWEDHQSIFLKHRITTDMGFWGSIETNLSKKGI